MNLLDKIWLGLLIFTTLIIFSCEDPSEVGLGLDPNGLKSGVFYEEINLSAQNVFIDSLVTSNNTRMLVGRVSDEIYGTTSAISYNQLSTSSIVQSLTYELDDNLDTLFSEKYVVDSAVLTLQYTDIQTLDNSDIQTIRIQQLKDQLFSSVYYLSNYTVDLEPLEEGNEFQVFFRFDSLAIDSYDTLKLYLPQTWANSLFDIATNSDRSQLLSNDFKGIAIAGGETNSSLVSFFSGGETALNVHYHVEANKRDTSIGDSIYNSYDSVAVSLSLAGARFSGIKNDPSGSTIGSAIGESHENFDTEDGNLYLNSIAGIYPKIDMQPYLDFLARDENQFIQINRFEFNVPTQLNSFIYDKNVSSLRFLYSDSTNKVNTTALSSSNLFSAGILTDNLDTYMTAALDSTTLSYVGISTFFSQLVENETIEVEDLILMPLDLTLPRQSVFPKDSIKLKVFYSIPN